jgi:DNA-binding IclR family transcriptional regulator
MGVKAIAQSLGMVTSTCLHILRVLLDEELVKVDATKRYSLGVGMLSLARSVIAGNRFPAAVQPVLDRLARQWSVTAIGVEVVGLDHMVVLALSHSEMPFRLHVDVGSRFPALISATGRLVAAYNTRPWREIEQRFKSLRWQNPPTLALWRAEMERVRKNGYSIDRGNYISGVLVLAVPVLNAHGELAHTLVIAGVADQLDKARCVEVANDMQAEAAKLSALLFGRSDEHA